MKKIIAFLFLSALGTLSLQASDLPVTLSKKLSRKIASALKEHSAIRANLRIDFQISEFLYKPNAFSGSSQFKFDMSEIGPYKADLACKAYVLDSHWLIVSGTCMRPSNEKINFFDLVYSKRKDRQILSPFEISGFPIPDAIPAQNIAYNRNIMLLWTDNKQLVSFLKKIPAVNVLAVRSAKNLFALSAASTFKVNTARFGLDAIRERTLKADSYDNNYFQLNEGLLDLSATATDPLFLVSKTGKEFLVGFNNGLLSYTLQITQNDIWETFDGKPSADFFPLTLEDLNFIKSTVLNIRPQDWISIQPRLFYNQTKTPYFNLEQ